MVDTLATSAPGKKEISEEETETASALKKTKCTDLDPKLLEILVCPITKGRLEYDRTHAELISRSAKCAYPIIDGVPIMLPDRARPLED